MPVKLSPEAEAVLADMRKHGDTTASQVGKRIGMSARHARARILVLVERGLVEFVCARETTNRRVEHFYRAKSAEEKATPVDVWALHRAVQSMVGAGEQS